MEQWGSDQSTPSQSAADERRHVVAQAIGVLVAQFGIDSEAAFDRLAGVARDEDRAVVDVSREIVANGGLHEPFDPPEQSGGPPHA